MLISSKKTFFSDKSGIFMWLGPGPLDNPDLIMTEGSLIVGKAGTGRKKRRKIPT
jgi:hypothetical protein